ncbi:MAG TPA: sugar phosphate isomerase/epimerase family protein [Bacteroidales bacterium]|nr:sugar phosphate isomerase/epimerase family protein [Bacteroidales bacterium]
MKQAIIISFLGKTQDRFSEYQKPATTIEKLEMISKINGFDGVEMVFPYENMTPEETVAAMKKYNLSFAAINVNIKKEPEWIAGALTRPDKGIRDRAVNMIKKAKDFAKAVGAPLVTCCPLSDGYDLLFQVNYRDSWNYMVETIGEASEYLPEIPLFIEPKYSETRVHCQLDSTAKALLLLREVNNSSTGITLDIGHSLQSSENPAQSLVTIYESGFDAYIHTNDNDTKADWDLIGASRHFLHYVELMFWARQYNYNKYFTTDASPRIFNVVEFFNNHSEITKAAYDLAGSLNAKHVFEMMKNEDYDGLMKMVNKSIYRI